MEWDATAARAKLREIIKCQDEARGRPLTDAEKLDNLARSLDMDPDQFRIHIAIRNSND